MKMRSPRNILEEIEKTKEVIAEAKEKMDFETYHFQDGWKHALEWVVTQNKFWVEDDDVEVD